VATQFNISTYTYTFSYCYCYAYTHCYSDRDTNGYTDIDAMHRKMFTHSQASSNAACSSGLYNVICSLTGPIAVCAPIPVP